MTLYGRLISVAVAGLTITEPRIHAVVERHADNTQTSGLVDIYNLSPGHEQSIYERAETIIIQAGYPSTIATIFEGQVQRVQRPRQNLARIVHIELGDAVRGKDALGSVTARSYDGPVPIKQIALDFVADMGLTPGPTDAIPGDTVKDFAWAGPSTEGLTVILKRVEVGWYEDDGLIRFRRAPMLQSDAPSISVSPSTGLVGAPYVTDEGAECVMFLNPAVKKGGRLTLASETITGAFRIVAVRHDADSWEGSFITHVDLRSL